MIRENVYPVVKIRAAKGTESGCSEMTWNLIIRPFKARGVQPLPPGCRT